MVGKPKLKIGFSFVYALAFRYLCRTMAESYLTIKNKSEGLYKEKGSKFLSFAIPVSNIEEIKEILKDYRKEFYDARHVCYAYMLGADRDEFRANDDGEPSGTAGRPILGQINSRNLTNVLVIVVRYFGGILLGTGGLIVAYKQAAADALDLAEIEERQVECMHKVHFDYPQMNDVMRILKEENASVKDTQYTNGCTVYFEVCKANDARLVKRMTDLRLVKLD